MHKSDDRKNRRGWLCFRPYEPALSALGTEREIRVRGSRSSPYFGLIANQLATESQGIETGRTYAHIFRYVSCGIGHNKTNRRTIQIADGQLDAINPPYHLPNTRLRAISAPRNGEFSSAFSGAIAPIRQTQPPLDLTHVFLEGTNRRPPRRLIQPLGIGRIAFR